MQFDVIVGNPPFQKRDGGNGASAVPIYNEFVELAKCLAPKVIAMITPARWLFGGRGLAGFRREMINDRRVRILIDTPDSRRVFKGVDVAGGVCAFVWDKNFDGDCRIVEACKTTSETVSVRPLLEPGADVFIRSTKTLSILKKIMAFERQGEVDVDSLALPEQKRFEQHVREQNPFGLRTYFRGSETKCSQEDVNVTQSGGSGWARRDEIQKGREAIDRWKVFTSKSSAEHAGQPNKHGQRRVLSKSGVLPPGSVVTESYVILGVFDTEQEARNCMSYVSTRLFRYLLIARCSGQDLARSAYRFVPEQDYFQAWSDAQLYKKYGLTPVEVEHIESTIRAWPVD
jgi:site-specific DNA-methyltransferase (adenine-specific)